MIEMWQKHTVHHTYYVLYDHILQSVYAMAYLYDITIYGNDLGFVQLVKAVQYPLDKLAT